MGYLIYFGAFILWFDHFLDSGAEICQIFCWFFGKFKTSKRHSEINWPLVQRKTSLPYKCWATQSFQLASFVKPFGNRSFGITHICLEKMKIQIQNLEEIQNLTAMPKQRNMNQ